MQPSKSILSKDFKYTSAVKTDLAATFARIRKQQQSARPTAILRELPRKERG